LVLNIANLLVSFTAEALKAQRVNIFPFAADLPSLKLWQGRVAGKRKILSPADGGTAATKTRKKIFCPLLAPP
jgi:hypothetical protein